MAAVTTDTGRAPAPDGVQRLALALAALVGVGVALVGSGAFGGTPVAEAAGGALSAEATLVAPAGPAFSIWSVIYTGLIALAAFQLLPARADDRRRRRIVWLVVASLLLNAAWILCVQAGWVPVTVVVILALLAVLVVTFVRLRETRPGGRVEAVVVDGTMGLYLGWVSIATVANVAAALADAGMPRTGDAATGWAVAVLIVAAGVGVLLAVTGRGRFAPAAALSWGLAWIAVARSTAEPESVPTAVAAAAAAAVVVAVTLAVRAREETRTRARA